MKRVTIKYNPYLVTTQIKVDGQSPKPNSSLKVENSRLQEWVERLPQILMDEYRDTNFEIAFTGTQADFDDVVSAVGAFGNKVNIKCELNKTADIADAEATIDSIFEEIKKGPVTELKDPRIIEAFEKAKNSQFEINVVATMSSGKSTLINALLGKQLMPAANEATTATIVRIIDTDQEKFSADAYDKSHNKVKHIDDVTITDMKALNDDEKISFVTLKGHIPFVSSTGMRLVLVDTPGPNNSRDKRHEEMTYKMIADSDKSLVLYVMNGEQLGINDEKIFLDYVCKNMKEGGKQSRERFIFAVNRMDRYSVKTEGTDCVEKALNNVKEGLVERGIYNPNIFPVTALAALEKRTDDDEPMAIDSFRRNTNKYDTFHFENYYHYSHLPQIAHQRIDKWLEESEGDDRVEIHTGIVSIEQAISMYINKYARTTKVCDLVQSFKDKLEELAAVANLQDAIAKDKSKKEELSKQIQKIKENIETANNAKTLSDEIDKIDLTKEIKGSIKKYLDGVKDDINRMMSRCDNKVEKSIAEGQCRELEKQVKAISAQIKVEIEKILEKSYKDTINEVVEQYKQYLSALNIGFSVGELNLNPVKLVSSSLSDLSKIMNQNTENVDESYNVKEQYQQRVEGGFIRKAASFLTFGLIEDHTYETREREKRIARYIDYVDMNEVASDYIIPFQESLIKTEESAVEYVKEETERLKTYLKSELVEIDKLLESKLNALSRTEGDLTAKGEEIATKEQNLKWLMDIQQKVKSIIEF
jgi:hypothetical protein